MHGVWEKVWEPGGKESGSAMGRGLGRPRPTQREQEDMGNDFERDKGLGKRRLIRREQGDMGNGFGSKRGKESGKDCERRWERQRRQQSLRRCGSDRENKNRGRSSLYQQSKTNHRGGRPDRCWQSNESRMS